MTSVIYTINVDSLMVPIKERLGVEALAAVIINFKDDDIDGNDEMVRTLDGFSSFAFALKKLNLDFKNRVTPLDKPSIGEPLVLDSRLFHSIFVILLGVNNSLSIIIADNMEYWKVEALVSMFQMLKRAIG